MSSSATNQTAKTSTEAKSNKKSSSASKSKTKNSNTNSSSASGVGGGSGNGSSSNTGSKSKESAADSSNEKSTGGGGGGIFKPLVVLALPGVNLFRRFSQYRRLPQEPPKDKLEVELERLNNKIDNLLDKLDEVEAEKADNSEEECIVCESNKATMQTFPCTHQVVCRTCFVRTIQTTVANRKLPLRCVLCRAKILRLKQHHKGQHGPHRRPPVLQPQELSDDASVPQSVSNYSFSRLSSSSSNHSFASGVSSVSSGSSVSSRSVRSFNFDTFSNFQNVNLVVHKNHLTRTTSGSSFSGRRRSRSPSPVGIGVRSRSMDGRMPKITVDRTPSDESLASSCAQMSMTSPGSSSSPRSPISPPWSSTASGGSRSPNGGAFFPGNGNGSAQGSPNSPSGNGNGLPTNNANHVQNVNLTEQSQQQQQQLLQQPQVMPTYQVNERRTSRLCTPLSPIKESRREGSGSSLELRCSPEPERSMTSSPVTPVDNAELCNMAALISWDDDEGDLKQTTPTPTRNQKPISAATNKTTNNSSGNNKPKSPHQSSRIRCTDKILNQLEIHADAVLAQGSNKNTKLKSNVDPSKRNAIIFGDIADRANANNPLLTRNASLDESLDNMKIQENNKPRKTVTFKDC